MQSWANVIIDYDLSLGYRPTLEGDKDDEPASETQTQNQSSQGQGDTDEEAI